MTELAPSRRTLLAGAVAGGLGAVAGCLGNDDNDGQSGGDGPELSLSLSRVDGTLRDRHVRGRDEPADHWDEAALGAVLAGDSYTTQHRKPFFAEPDDPAYVRDEGTYYRLRSVAVDEVAETHPVFRLFEAEDEVESPVDGSEGGELPQVDQRAVRIAHFAARARGNEGGYPADLVDRGGYAYRTAAAREESALLAADAPDHVRHRDTTYRVEIDRERFHETVYQPTAEPVAERPERMEAILRATFVGPRIGADDLSAEARRIVDRADADEYGERYPYSDEYTALLRALDARPYLDGGIRNDAGVLTERKEMIRYGDDYYEWELRLSGGD